MKYLNHFRSGGLLELARSFHNIQILNCTCISPAPCTTMKTPNQALVMTQYQHSKTLLPCCSRLRPSLNVWLLLQPNVTTATLQLSNCDRGGERQIENEREKKGEQTRARERERISKLLLPLELPLLQSFTPQPKRSVSSIIHQAMPSADSTRCVRRTLRNPAGRIVPDRASCSTQPLAA